MTPRINEAIKEIDLSEYSERLMEQLTTQNGHYKLNGQGAISNLTHPAIMKCEFLYAHHPDLLTYRCQSGEYNILSFMDKSEALSHYRDIRLYQGFPWNIWQFLRDKPSRALINFEGLGCVYLSKDESFAPVLVPSLHHYTLPLYLDYALSSELWGPAGKWSRFHERLHGLFATRGLLLDQDFPGFYPLVKESSWLEECGFIGQHTPRSFNLIMTWDFPLSGLIKLEDAIARRP